jgi:starch synthase
MYALKYGTPPVATAVGGLRDSIVPWPDPDATGFTYYRADANDLYQAIMDAYELWEHNRPRWKDMMIRAMHKDFTWKHSAASYIELYRELGFKG